MDLAALVIAGVGLILAVLSWKESRKSRLASEASADAARRSAEAATETAQLDVERRHDELSPRVRVEWGHVGGKAGNAWRDGVRIINELASDYAEVRAVLLRPRPGDAPAARQIQSVTTGAVGDQDRPISLGSLRAGEATALLIFPVYEEDDLPRGGTAPLKLTFVGDGGQEWELHHDAEIPRPPRVYSL